MLAFIYWKYGFKSINKTTSVWLNKSVWKILKKFWTGIVCKLANLTFGYQTLKRWIQTIQIGIYLQSEVRVEQTCEILDNDWYSSSRISKKKDKDRETLEDEMLARNENSARDVSGSVSDSCVQGRPNLKLPTMP